MTDRKDFIRAIGKPDKAFENSVQQALDEILLSERRDAAKKRSPARYILPAAVIMAAAACAFFLLLSPDNRPDIVSSGNGVMSQPSAAPAVTPEPTPLPEEGREGVEVTTEIPEQPAITPEPTPPPIAAGSLPEDHWMLVETLNINIDQLYPGYTYADTATDKGGNRHWMLSNGTESILGCSITRGSIIHSASDTGVYQCPALHVYMPDAQTSSDHIMAGASPWLKDVYEKSCAIVDRSADNTHLNTLQITFDENNEPRICEMYFGLNCEFYISWLLGEDGSAEIVKLYSTPESVPLDYDDPNDYDTMEVAFEDPVLEAAIRAELNWDGALTPAKLAGLTGLQLVDTPIESLSGLEYCTGLEWLELSGCGIDDDDLKYIGSLPKLFTLGLGNNAITDITDLSSLDLGWLHLSGNEVSSLWPISGMTNLYELYLDENPLSAEGALSPLRGLTGMRRLYLNSCGITDASPIAELAANASALEAVYLYGNPIDDYSPIKELDIPELCYGY